MNFPTIKEIVERYELAPKKSLGQNFIYDLDLTSKIVAAAGDITGADILEIGPGAGSLTRAILSKKIKSLTAIEHDSRCIKALSYLKKNYGDKFNLIEADGLKYQLDKKVTIIANLPYNISTELLFKWIEQIQLIDKMVLMFQKEVANRLIAGVGDNNYGKLSIVIDLFFDRYKCMDLPPVVFHPAPKIDSSVIFFKANPTKYQFNYKPLMQIITTCFNLRRKKLTNSLSNLIPTISEVLEQNSISKDARPEELSTTDFINIAKYI